MATDLLDSYARACHGPDQGGRRGDRLDARRRVTSDVHTLMNHMLKTQRYFLSAAQGIDAEPPGAEPPELLGPDPRRLRRGRSCTLESFGARSHREGGFVGSRPATSSCTAGTWPASRPGLDHAADLAAQASRRPTAASPRTSDTACSSPRSRSATTRPPGEAARLQRRTRSLTRPLARSLTRRLADQTSTRTTDQASGRPHADGQVSGGRR